MNKYLFVIVLATLATNLSAQDAKREFEKTIKEYEAPDRIRAFIYFFFPDAEKIKYYYESDGAQEFYEVKLMWRNRPLSVEFYKNTRLMDIEELIDFQDLPEAVHDSIAQFFEGEYDKHHINRTQIQYSSPSGICVVEALILKDYSAVNLAYEIEADVAPKNGGGQGAYEFLFNSAGKLIQARPIIKRTSDNVTY